GEARLVPSQSHPCEGCRNPTCRQHFRAGKRGARIACFNLAIPGRRMRLQPSARLEHLFGNALANDIGFRRMMEDRRWRKVIKNYSRRSLHVEADPEVAYPHHE